MTNDTPADHPAPPAESSTPRPARWRRFWPLGLGLLLAGLLVPAARMGLPTPADLIQAYRFRQIIASCRPAEREYAGSIPFEFLAHAIIIKVRVDGDSVARDFVLDTGASTTAISQSFIDRIKPRHRSTRIAGMSRVGAGLEDDLLRLDGIEIGGVRFRDVGALVLDSARMGALSCLSPNGIIGCNVLRSGAWQIDYPARRIRFADRLDRLGVTGDSGRVAFTTRSRAVPSLVARLDDTLGLNLIVDTGYNGRVRIWRPGLALRVSAAHPERIRRVRAHTLASIDGEQPAQFGATNHVYRATRFEVGRRRLDDCPVTLTEEPHDDLDGVVGNGLLKHFVLTLDFPRREIYLRARPPVVWPGNQKTYGLQFAPVGNDVVVVLVSGGSDAEKGGIELGDRLLAIDGIRQPALTRDEPCQIIRGRRELLPDKDSVVLDLVRGNAVFRRTLRKAPLFPDPPTPAATR